ncbi:MAG: DUF3465 domain-containing protein [Candidatus Melainabacteria bacterium]|nr:DUF3465 domain-containing protein [Candidatus Melainabacteria bacterium]
MPTHALATRLGRRLQGKDGEDAEAVRTATTTTTTTTTVKDGRLFTPINTPVNTGTSPTANINPYGALSSNLVPAQAGGSAPGRAPAEVIEAVDDAALVEAQERHLMNYQVEGAARVLKILPEDLKGRAHQRFLLKLSNGGTILVAHNIDLAPRVPLSAGDVVRVRGEFVWNQKGGVIHYTHRSTSRARQGGWIRFRSLFYQ